MKEMLLATAAESVTSGLGVAGSAAGMGSTAAPVTTIVGGLISAILGLSGIVFVIMVVYAGILYLTSQGEEGNIKKAKKLLSSSIIGLIIIVSSYAIATYVFAALATITT